MTGPSSRLRPPIGPPTAVATIVFAAALVVATGPIGLAIAAVTLGTWILAPVPYAIAAGHVALVALSADGFGPLTVAIVEIGFVAILTAALADRAALAAAAVTLAATGLVAWAAVATLPLWVAATTVLLTLAAIGYAVHRLELVQFGLVQEGRDGRERVTDGETRS